MKLTDDDTLSFMSGFALAVGDLARNGYPTLAAGLIAGHGFTLKDFAAVDDYDKRVIRKLFREEAQLRRSALQPKGTR